MVASSVTAWVTGDGVEATDHANRIIYFSQGTTTEKLLLDMTSPITPIETGKRSSVFLIAMRWISAVSKILHSQNVFTNKGLSKLFRFSRNRSLRHGEDETHTTKPDPGNTASN